ncbi:MAG: hypothetical protein ACI9FG_001513, partial [Crocinitomicaceae bacterium]
CGLTHGVGGFQPSVFSFLTDRMKPVADCVV